MKEKLRRKPPPEGTRAKRSTRSGRVENKNAEPEASAEPQPTVPFVESDNDSLENETTTETVMIPDLDPAKVAPLSQENCKILDLKFNPLLKAQLIDQIAQDDEFIRVTSRRAILVKFLISQPSAIATEPEATTVVAPECASVEYLKRRYLRSKLRMNTFVHVERLCLRRPHDSAIGDPGERLNEKSILYNLGFHAGGSYKLILQSIGKMTEEEKQAQLDSTLGLNAFNYSTNPEIRLYQQMLRQDLPESRAPPQNAINRVAPIIKTDATAFLPAAPSTSHNPGAMEYISQPLAAHYHPADSHPQHSGSIVTHASHGLRQGKGGPWSDTETLALIYGVREFGKSWAAIHKKYSQKPVASPNRPPEEILRTTRFINGLRDQVSYKDKWRTLVNASAPGAKTRAQLPEELKEMIRQIEGEYAARAELAKEEAQAAAIAAARLAAAHRLADAENRTENSMDDDAGDVGVGGGDDGDM